MEQLGGHCVSTKTGWTPFLAFANIGAYARDQQDIENNTKLMIHYLFILIILIII